MNTPYDPFLIGGGNDYGLFGAGSGPLLYPDPGGSTSGAFPSTSDGSSSSSDPTSGLMNGDRSEYGAYLQSLIKQNEWNQAFQEAAMLYNRQEAQAQRDFSALEAQKARDYQKSMQDTYYQRLVADMKAAGLNPALMFGSFSGGSSAVSAPMASGASASVGVTHSGSGSQFNFENVANTALKGADILSKFITGILKVIF